ncbi:MAG: hypothetical protein HXS50_04655 [Theionarchaea archaeon]|nr:hypothetical protein [Theionarchaea archaeon]
MSSLPRSSWLESLNPQSRESLHGIFRSYDLIGDIIVTRIPPQLEEMRREIGELLLEQNPKARLVLQAHGPTSPYTRTRYMRTIAGEGPPLTEHREHGTTYVVDVSRVCFTPRLSHERLRVAEQVVRGERILNMFSGVGSFSLLIARLVESLVFSADNNPAAIECVKRGIRRNQLTGTVLPIFGNSRRIFKRAPRFDRIILPLPSLSDEVLDLASDLTIPGGTIHLYREVRGLRGDCLATSLVELNESLRRAAIGEFHVIFSRVIRSVGKKRWHVVHDIGLP